LELQYADRYLFSPLAVRLASELVAGFATVDTSVIVKTLAQRTGPLRSPPGKTGVMDDWARLDDRNSALQHLLANVSPIVRVDLERRMGHRRRLDFRTAKGSGTIFFDQGVGSWRSAVFVPFDQRGDLAEQIETIGKPFAIANGHEGTFVACRLD
jgi:hypothetical protein